VTPREKISACAIAGGVSGAAGGLLRNSICPVLRLILTHFAGGRGNIVPGVIMFALFGAAGQTLYNMADARNSQLKDVVPDDRTKNSWLNSKWSPMKVLSDKEYEDMLREKLLRVNAEIALVDESIAALRAQEKEMAEQTTVKSMQDPRTK